MLKDFEMPNTASPRLADATSIVIGESLIGWEANDLVEKISQKINFPIDGAGEKLQT